MPQYKILLVDDSPNVLEALKRTLRFGGYEILTASSGLKALELMNAHKISLIIVDEHMPGVAGSDLLAAVKLKFPHVARILITGSNDIEALKRAVNRGEVFRFFTKPWDDLDLSIAVRQGIKYMSLKKRNAQLLEFIYKRPELLSQLESEFPDLTQETLSGSTLSRAETVN